MKYCQSLVAHARRELERFWARGGVRGRRKFVGAGSGGGETTSQSEADNLEEAVRPSEEAAVEERADLMPGLQEGRPSRARAAALRVERVAADCEAIPRRGFAA